MLVAIAVVPPHTLPISNINSSDKSKSGHNNDKMEGVCRIGDYGSRSYVEKTEKVRPTPGIRGRSYLTDH